MILDDWRENPQECGGLSHPILLGILGKISPKQTISGTFRRPICWTNDQDERESPTGMDVTQTCPSNRSPKSYRTSELASWAVATAQTSIGTSRYWWDFDSTFPDFSECLWPMRALGRFLALALLPPLLFVAPGRRATGVPGGCRGRSLARHVQRNPYDVLGLSSGCSYDDIRAAFRKLARSWWIFWGPKWQNGGDQKVFFLLKLGRIRINLLSIKVWVALFSDKPKLGIWKKQGGIKQLQFPGSQLWPHTHLTHGKLITCRTYHPDVPGPASIGIWWFVGGHQSENVFWCCRCAGMYPNSTCRIIET